MNAPTLRLRLASRIAGANGAALLCILLVAAAVLIRAPDFGNPAYHIDEQFYLLTGRALWGGELAYVDIWDRKPLGLFLLYAGIAALGGDAVATYQLVAGAFASATAVVIALTARRFAGDIGAGLAGIAYLAGAATLGGNGGQSPVFYNLFIAGAGWLTLQALADTSTDTRIYRLALGAMMLAGLAIFVKQVALFEGCFFGLVLLWSIYKRTGRVAAAIGWGASFVACGLLPTALAFGVYVALGAGEAFWFANFVSIFMKGDLQVATRAHHLVGVLVCLAPLILCAGRSLIPASWAITDERTRTRRFLVGWIVAAALGFVAVPNFYDHYALPLLVPLSIAAAATFADGRIGRGWATLPILWMIVIAWVPDLARAAPAKRDFDTAATIVRRHLRGGCLYVYEGPLHLYTATNACRATRFVFTDHLSSALEADALGVSADAEMRALLARAPTVIVILARIDHPANLDTRRILFRDLRSRYRIVGRVPAEATRTLLIWSRI